MGRVNRDGEQDTSEKKTGLPEEQMDEIGLNWSKAISVVAIVGMVLFLGIFFMSDIGERIVQSKQQRAQASTVETVSPKTDSLHIAILSGAETGKADIITYLESLSDADFEKLRIALLDKFDGADLNGTNALFESLKNGDISNKSDVIAYLNDMGDAEFDAFRQAVIAMVNPGKLDDSQQPDDSALTQTIEDAYAKAEMIHSGKIDGTKRLQLIAELNAGPYMYYVAEQGDTLIELSNAFGVTLGQLVELNGIHDANVIGAGDILLFPTDTTQPDIVTE